MRAGRGYAATLAKDLLRVEAGQVAYAIEVARIREVVHPLPVIDLPRRLAFVLGVAEYREQVVPVVDLRSFFDLPRALDRHRAKWVIVESAAGLVAVVVDAVLDVFSSEENPQRAVPVLDAHHRDRGIRSAFRHDGQLAFLLDVNRITEPAIDVPRERPSGLPREAT